MSDSEDSETDEKKESETDEETEDVFLVCFGLMVVTRSNL